MSNRRRSANSVSLFPFLAVLICAMGALIFLLLVTTRRVRLQAVARAREIQLETAAAATTAVPPPVAEPEREPDLVPPQLPAETESAPAGASLNDLLVEWEQRTAELSRQRDALQAAFQDQQQRLAERERLATDLHAELTGLEQRLNDTQADRKQSSALAAALAAEQARTAEQMLSLQRQIGRKREELSQRASRFMVVPFDVQSGTSRRPILIECTDEGLRFLPEDIALTPSHFDGFTARYNPLLAGAAALLDYWRTHGDPSQPQPYVLLLVRPSGTMGYYVAKRMLSALEHESGYELIEEDWQLALPPAEPQAAAACRAAIEQVLNERTQVANLIGDRRAAFGSSRHTRGGESEFTFDDLERGESSRGRTWERPDEFGGQQHRSAAQADPALSREAGAFAAGGQQREAASGAIGRPGGGSIGGTSEGPANSNGGAQSRFPPDTTTGHHPAASPLGQASSVPSQSLEAPAEPDRGESPRPQFGPTGSRSDGERQLAAQMNRRRWGLSSPSATIGLERTVRMDVQPQRIVVGGETAIPVGQGETREELLARVAAALDRHCINWGQPPNGFYWVPTIKYVVSPGGNLHYERLHAPLTKWGLTSDVEFTLGETDTEFFPE